MNVGYFKLVLKFKVAYSFNFVCKAEVSYIDLVLKYFKLAKERATN